MRPPKASRPTPWLTRVEQRRLLHAVRAGGNLRDLALVQFALHTGLRLRELCAVTWGDVQLTDAQGTLKVLGSPNPRRGGRLTLARTIPLNAPARRVVQLLQYAQPPDATAPLFVGQRGRVTPRGIEALLHKYTRPANLPGITVGTLRHTFCRNLVEAGADVATIATLAGHPTVETAWRYFERPTRGLDQVVELLPDEAVGPPAVPLPGGLTPLADAPG